MRAPLPALVPRSTPRCAPWYPASMPATRARPLTNAERQRRYRARPLRCERSSADTG